jgi:putative Mg2+ transporter-C (MgtC) family protein
MDDLNFLLRALIALALSSVIGWEREAMHKPAGLRTHALVGVSAALFVVLAEVMIEKFNNLGGGIKLDPIAVIGATVSGIGFLGAGTIFMARGSGRAHGLTTAASLLATAAIGLSVGLERYVLAGGSTLIILTVMRAMRWLEGRIGSVAEMPDVPDP